MGRDLTAYRGWFGAAVAALALGTLGCPPDPTGNYQGCEDDTDCLNGYRCVQGGSEKGQCLPRDQVGASASSSSSSSAAASSSGASGAASTSSASSSGAGASSSAAASSGGGTCDLVQLTAVCGALGMAQDGVACRCVAMPMPDAGMVDAGCNVMLLGQVCAALGLVVDAGACLCAEPVPDGGPVDAGPPECREDTDCATGEFCCGRMCYPANASTIRQHCGCVPSRIGDQGVNCGTATTGRVCVGSAGTSLEGLGAGVRGLLAGAVCGCTGSGLSSAECGETAGLAGICEDHRCVPQDDRQCGLARVACSGLRGGNHCVRVADGGVGGCACATDQPDATLECSPVDPFFTTASRCEPLAAALGSGTCRCGTSTACAGTSTSTCCSTGGSSNTCVDVTTDDDNCGVCGVSCYDATTHGCAVRLGPFPACSATGPENFNASQCRGPGSTVTNPRATTDRQAASGTASNYPCVCSSFRANGGESACPPGRFCCPARDGGPTGCCTQDCSSTTNSCISTWPPDGGA